MNDSDREDLKTHGYLFSGSDSDSESSSDNDKRDSAIVAKRNHTGVRFRSKIPSLPGSGQSSSLSDFDDDYYAVQPPAISIKNFKDRIVKIKAKDGNRENIIKTYADICNELDVEAESENAITKLDFGSYKGKQEKQKENKVLKNISNLSLQSRTNCFKLYSEASKPNKSKSTSNTSTGCTEEFLCFPEVAEVTNTVNYFEEFFPLPELSKNTINTSTGTNVELSSLVNGFNYLKEFPSLPQRNKNRRIRNSSASSVGTIKKISCLPGPETPKHVNGFDHPQEFPSLVRPNTTSTEATENTAKNMDATIWLLMSNFGDNFLTLSDPEVTENNKIDHASILSLTCSADEFLTLPEEAEYVKNNIITTTPLSVSDTFLVPSEITKTRKINNTVSETSITEEALTPSTISENIKIRRNTGTLPISRTSEQILPDKDTYNRSSIWLSAFAEPVKIQAQKTLSTEPNCDTHLESALPKMEKPTKKNTRLENPLPKVEKSTKKKNKLKSNKRILLLIKNTEINSYNSAEDLIAAKCVTEEIKVQKITTMGMKINTKKNQELEFQELFTRQQDSRKSSKKSKQVQSNNKTQPKTTLNKNKMGPKKTIFQNGNNYGDSVENLVKDNFVYNSERKVPHFIRHQLARNNNATLARVRLAGERRRRRFNTRLDRDNDDLVKQAFVKSIILLLLIYGFYSLKCFLNLYIKNIFEICDND